MKELGNSLQTVVSGNVWYHSSEFMGFMAMYGILRYSPTNTGKPQYKEGNCSQVKEHW